jgi:serralysin
MIGADAYTIWSVDSQGHFTVNIGHDLSGNSAALESFETIFYQDLNGDGTIGPPAPVVIQTDNTTALTESNNAYYLDNTGTGPELTQGGVAVAPSIFTAIGAVQLAGGGYDVAWKTVDNDAYTI